MEFLVKTIIEQSNKNHSAFMMTISKLTEIETLSAIQLLKEKKNYKVMGMLLKSRICFLNTLK